MEQGFWLALLIGGIVVAGLSAGQQLVWSKEQFRMKPVGRDFILGAFISAMIYHLMPDTVVSVVEKGQEAISSLATTASGGGLGSVQEMDVHLGPPRF
jgi:hypothetical protein